MERILLLRLLTGSPSILSAGTTRGAWSSKPVWRCATVIPSKLHYSWCLSRIGAAPPERFEDELAQVRRAFAAGTLGLADLVLVSIPLLETLQRQRNADPTRRRRHFDLHSQLGEHLQTWYAGVDALDPGRVIWQLPAEGLPADVPQPRDQRSDLALLDALTAWLPPASANAGQGCSYAGDGVADSVLPAPLAGSSPAPRTRPTPHRSDHQSTPTGHLMPRRCGDHGQDQRRLT